MAVGWSGADPVQVADSDTYEMGTVQKANVDVTITGVRVWSGASPLPITPRTATVWSTGGAVLSTVTLPSSLAAGWTVFPLGTPVERTTGQQWVVSFSSGGNYGYIGHGLDSDVVSSDGAVTSLGFAGAPSSANGRFNATPGDFPAAGNAQHGFYGVDVSYDLGIGGNTAPEITALELVDIDGTVTAVATVADAETLVGATLRFDFGDFLAPEVTTYPTLTASRTYTASGVYAVLVSITDADGKSGYRAGAVTVTVPPDQQTDGLDVTRILNAITSHAAQLGPFERIQTHEPKTAPTNGLTGAVWVASVDPVQGFSGLATTSVRIAFILRLYANMVQEPQDDTDPMMVKVANDLLNAYHGDFTLGGLVSMVDLVGGWGDPLRVVSGYIPQDGKMLRAMSIYLPVIVADAWNQAG